jgi:hypothetical protein
MASKLKCKLFLYLSFYTHNSFITSGINTKNHLIPSFRYLTRFDNFIPNETLLEASLCIVGAANQWSSHEVFT